MSTTSSNLSLTLATTSDVVDVAAHIADNFALLDTKWSTAGTPAAVQVGATGTPGASTVVARSDHIHGITAGTVSSTGTANSAGSNTTVAASDHVHKVGDNSVVTAAIADNAITQAKMADASVGAAELIDANIAPGKLYAANAPSDAQVLAYSLADLTFKWRTASDLVSTAIADASITRAKLEALERELIGKVDMYAGSSMTTPNAQGWLLCDGSAVSRATYGSLFTAIGTTWGVGDGSTTFNLPNFTDKFPVGSGSAYALGATNGTSTTINIAHVHAGPSHQHGASALGVSGNTGSASSGTNSVDNPDGGGSSAATPDHTHNQGSMDVTGSTDFAGSGDTDSRLSSAQSILPPYRGIKFIIYSGVAS